jgi:hypothetical protein
VKGSGYLFADTAAGVYAGAVQLDVKGLTVQAVGLITTKLPDGSRGYSLLVIVTVADFSPVNLGFGFRLTGVGGLVGYNRTANVDALRAGLKNRSLDAVLFPENPAGDAPQIITALQTIMPARDGQYMIGLIGRIVWGVPVLVTIELGVVIEFPSPVRLLVLGQIRALLPHQDHPLVRLQMDVLGVVDWDRNEISIDASLYDSHVLTHALTGDMALRGRWGSDPIFLLAIGGFNPRFPAPPGFPKLERAALTLTRGDTVRLRLEAYFALTSNTAQIGSRIELLVRKAGFTIEGYLGFDALFQFSPFNVIVDIRAGVELKWFGRTLLGVDLELTLSGPSPWHAYGKATFKIWRFSKSVCFNEPLGAEEPPPPLPAADPMPELVQALSDSRNWSAQLPPATSTLFTFRERRDTTELLIHPAGELSVRQRIVPLGITIDRYGSSTPSNDRRFTVSLLPLGGVAAGEIVPVLDFFAAAQFLEMSDAAKLRRPSFEEMEAGIQTRDTLHFGGEDDPALVGEVSIEYETVVAGIGEDVRSVVPLDIDGTELRARTAFAGNRSLLRRTGSAKYSAPGSGIAVAKLRYVIASTRDLAVTPLPGLDGGAPSYTAAWQAMQEHTRQKPGLRGEFQVVTRSTARTGVL